MTVQDRWSELRRIFAIASEHIARSRGAPAGRYDRADLLQDAEPVSLGELFDGMRKSAGERET